MAGGPSTPALAAAVSDAGGLGFLAAGYKTAERLGDEIRTVRGQTTSAFGVNVFVPSGDRVPDEVVSRYAAALAPEADRYGVALGVAHFDDDGYDAKLALLLGERIPVVSFTFGSPTPEIVAELHDRDTAVWITVTNVAEARQAIAVGADGLVAQGTEAGGHRAYFGDDADHEEYGLLVLLALLGTHTRLPLIATGGIMNGPGVAAVLAAGAAAAQLGSALMLTSEAGTSAPHRDRLATPSLTRLTRAFSGRPARGIVNRFMNEHDPQAPRAYPQVHHLTTPVRAAARASGDPDAINLWAGQGHELARQLPAAELVRELAADAAATLTALARRFPTSSAGRSRDGPIP